MKTTIKNVAKSILFAGFMFIIYMVGIDFTGQMLSASNSMENVAGLALLIVGLSGIPWTVLTVIKIALPNMIKDSEPTNGF